MLTCLGDVKFHSQNYDGGEHKISFTRFHKGTVWDLGFDFAEAVTGETDRGIGILSATVLDVMLEKLIFVSLPSGDTKDIFGPDKIFSSFSRKIQYCELRNLINKKHAKNANIIRKIRNSFAHDLSGSFSNGTIKSRIDALDFWDLEHLSETSQMGFRFKSQVITLMLSISTIIHYAQCSSRKNRKIYDFPCFDISDQKKRGHFEHLQADRLAFANPPRS
jgi:mannitol operon repressor